jgi:hypothetical protein
MTFFATNFSVSHNHHIGHATVYVTTAWVVTKLAIMHVEWKMGGESGHVEHLLFLWYAMINHIHWTPWSYRVVELQDPFLLTQGTADQSSELWSTMSPINFLPVFKIMADFMTVSKLYNKLKIYLNIHLIACRKYSTPCSYSLNASV